MATSYPAPVGAIQVGSYFVQQYYQILQQQPDFVHHFYKDASTMVRVDGDANVSASAVLQIHTLIMSLNFTGIEIKTINSLESWNGGVLVVVSGSVKSKDFSGWRKFVQSFFLAPQENGYFVLNDIFHFASDEVIHQHTVPVPPENRVDSPVTNDTSLPDSPAHRDYALEVEPSENLDSVRIEGDDAVHDYTIPEEQQQQPPPQQPQPQPPQTLQSEEEKHIPESESSVEEETPVEEPYVLPPQNVVEDEPEPLPADVEEPVGEPRKLTYASILQAPKGKYAPTVASHPIVNKSAPPVSDWPQMPQPTPQPLNPVPPFVPNNATVEVVAEENLSQEGDSKSIYARNLPTTVSTFDILKEFKRFGAIKTDGVVMKNRKETGVCFAFVEFEDVESAQNAIKASPIQLEGRQVYIEERRTNSTPSSRGGRGRGRGRGSYQNEGGRGRFGGRNFGRGSNQDGADNYRARGNGVRGSY